MQKRILVVEDNDLNRKLFCDVLQASGFDVEPVADGNDAIERARSFFPNLVVMDIQLQDVSGLDLIADLKRDAALADVPVRYLSTGQRKRAAILQSNARKAGIWLLDEPLNGLDVDAASAFQDRLASYLAGGGIAIIASHQPFHVPSLQRLHLTDFEP